MKLKHVWIQFYETREFHRIQNFVITFKKIPSVLCAGFTNLLYDFEGRPCQNIFDARKIYPAVSVSLFSTKHGGAVVFSWLDVAGKEAEQFCNSLSAIPTEQKTSAIIRMLFEYCENIALNPMWWESLQSLKQDNLMERFYNGVSKPRRAATCLVEDLLELDDWHPEHSFFI